MLLCSLAEQHLVADYANELASLAHQVASSCTHDKTREVAAAACAGHPKLASIRGSRPQPAPASAPPDHDRDDHEHHERELDNVSLVVGQLLALLCATLVLLYAIELVQVGMTNIFNKLLGSERRRSVGSHAHHAQQPQQGSTLSLARPAAASQQPAASGAGRRASRASIQSVSAMLFGALTSSSSPSSPASSSSNGNVVFSRLSSVFIA